MPMTKDFPGFSTRAIHAGQEADPRTGAVVPPIYATSTCNKTPSEACGKATNTAAPRTPPAAR